MTLLSMIQTAADVIGLPRPLAVMSSTETQVRQLLALANVEGKSLAKRGRWTDLIAEATHTTLAQEDQGAIADIAPGFNYFINRTQQNRTQQDPLGGPISAETWQTLKASSVSGPYYSFRVRQGRLLMYPQPPAGDTVAFEFMSKNWCQSAANVGQESWSADTDTGVLSEDLMMLGIVWRYKQAKGFDYAEDFRTYETQVNDALGRDGGSPTEYLDSGYEDYNPTIRVPEGNWQL